MTTKSGILYKHLTYTDACGKKKSDFARVLKVTDKAVYYELVKKDGDSKYFDKHNVFITSKNDPDVKIKNAKMNLKYAQIEIIL